MNRPVLIGISTILTLLLALTGTSAFAASISQECEHGNGKAKTETREIPEFNALEVSGAFEIKATAGQNRQTVSITADENILPLIATELQGNQLKIYPSKPICTEMAIVVEINVANLVSLLSSGSDNVKIEGLDNDKFSVSMSGSSDVELAGKAMNLNAEISGAGKLDAKDLKTAETGLNISGSGSADVYATEKLQVEIVGVGEVNYYGNPKKIDKQIIGVGNLNRM
jgi:hypothetical protein